MASKLVEAVLRRAINQGGKMGYNPDMYDFGFADNIPPSEEFNDELRQYGHLNYSSRFSDDGFVYGHSEIWSSFTIDERGREYIKEIDKKKNGPFKIKKIFRFFFMSFLLGFCFFVILDLGIEIVGAWLLCNIDAGDSYSWLGGIIHGLFIVPNFLRHLYNDDILYIADYHTTAYSVFYWITAVIVLIEHAKYFIISFFKLIADWFSPK